MDQFKRVLLDFWREACRHIEIHESAAGMADLLGAHLPLEHLIVFRIEPEHSLLATVASAPQSLDGLPGSRELPAADLKKLLAWVRRGAIVSIAAGAKLPIALESLHLPATDSALLLAPLNGSVGPIGVLVLEAPPKRKFNAQHESMLAAMQEPLSVALENDRRLHEMAALREAAEADRHSLLRRLGRRDIGDTIVGEQAGLRQVMERVELVSRSDAPVLILGETGTGKEVIARAIHTRSDRQQKPFIRVNCGAIPPELIDSQLFGHERGSFTGAAEARKGWFERADEGTLFLDEIGELPPDAQVRFLRVLQDGFIERVGGHEPLRVDVRVIAATHRDLSGMVGANRFREDLWYRIAVFPILLPPLRERTGDIAALARHFAERAAVRFGLTSVQPSEDDIDVLRGYAWPGNIRELGAVIDRAAILGEGNSLEIRAALGFGAGTPAMNHPTSQERVADKMLSVSSSGFLTLDEAMRQHIELALKRTQGRVEGAYGAAKLLKINPHTLRARMRKLKIDWQAFRDVQL